jgi:hypothetical protein
MRKRYDFSKSEPNQYLSKPKRQITIRLDSDTVQYFKSLSQQCGIPSAQRRRSPTLARNPEGDHNQIAIAT